MEPLKTCIDRKTNQVKLIPELSNWYGGNLSLPAGKNELPGVYSNFVTTADGRISFNQPGHMGGGDISMGNIDDRRIMALLRATADAVLVGANTLRIEPTHIWTPEFIIPDDPDFVRLVTKQREELGMDTHRYLHFFVTGSGHVNPDATVFTAENAEVWFITTKSGKKVIEEEFKDVPSILVVGDGKEVDMSLALAEIGKQFKLKHILCEGGPRVIGSLLKKQVLNGAFLSIANQVIGNSPSENEPDRPSWISDYHGQYNKSILLNRETVKFDPKEEMEFQSYQLVYPK